ncbi:MAG: sensor histidine kinase [Caldilineaceae bacterium]
MSAGNVLTGAHNPQYYNLTTFTLEEMTTCGAVLRKLGTGATSMEEVGDRIVRYLYDQFVDPQSGERACVLVRLFKTHAYDKLDGTLSDYIQKIVGGVPNDPTMKCLTLLATAGVQPEWNDRGRSVRYKAWPLTGQDLTVQYPMFTQLIQQFGVDLDAVTQPDPELLVDLAHTTFNVFHVADAVGNSYIPAQTDFVIPYGIRSVLGFGGMLPTGNLFAVILFSNVSIPRETAESFKTLALNVKMALLPFVEAPIFGGARAQVAAPTAPPMPLPAEEMRQAIARLRSQVAGLEQLLGVHERVVLEQAERNAQLHAQSAVLAERHRLARDLHDSVTQSMYSTILFTDAGRLALEADQRAVAAENLREARGMAGAALADLRLLLYELHPPELAEEGLAGALHNRLEAVELRAGLQVTFSAAGTLELSPDHEAELYKIAQEALNNVVKHAQATAVTVQIDGNDGECCLTIQDDGVGFAQEPGKQHAGMGLRSIHERVAQIGGALSIRSARGEGTRLYR